MGKIKLVLFDLDGVLVDAVKIHDQAFRAALMLAYGLFMSEAEHMERFNGLPTISKLQMLINEGRISNDRLDYINRLKQKMTLLLIKENLREDETKIKMLINLGSLGLSIGCVTNCSPETAELMLKKTDQLLFIDRLITNADIKNPKPDPEAYLLAMERFIALPEETLIVEDSPKGIQAARATGANVWEVSGPDEVTWENIQKHL